MNAEPYGSLDPLETRVNKEKGTEVVEEADQNSIDFQSDQTFGIDLGSSSAEVERDEASIDVSEIETLNPEKRLAEMFEEGGETSFSEIYEVWERVYDSKNETLKRMRDPLFDEEADILAKTEPENLMGIQNLKEIESKPISDSKPRINPYLGERATANPYLSGIKKRVLPQVIKQIENQPIKNSPGNPMDKWDLDEEPKIHRINEENDLIKKYGSKLGNQ